jgi:type I restriction enzyme S subunit
MARIPLSKTTKFIVDNRGRTAPTANSGIPLIATNCIDNKNLYPVYENIRYVSKETYETWFRSHPQPNDIIITLKGSQNGAVCLVPNPVDFAIAQDMVALRADENAINPLFLFAALRSEDVQHQIKNLDVSGVIPHFKKGDFDKLLIPYPDKDLQKTIGDTYFNFSKKIDLLQRQNKTLGKLAETLFRQWFVEEAAKSWEIRKLDDFFPIITGKRDANYGSEDGIYPFFTCSQKILKCDYYSYEGHAILLAGNGDFNLKRYKGRFEAYQRTYVLIPSDEKYVGFLFYLMKYFLNEMTSGAQGSVISFLTKGMIAQFEFRFPRVVPEAELKELNIINEHIDCNAAQIRTLTQLRDALLPKLMSGEVRVNQ